MQTSGANCEIPKGFCPTYSDLLEDVSGRNLLKFATIQIGHFVIGLTVEHSMQSKRSSCVLSLFHTVHIPVCSTIKFIWCMRNVVDSSA